MTKHDISKYVAEMEAEARKEGRADGYAEGWQAAMLAFREFSSTHNSPPPRSRLSEQISQAAKPKPNRATGVRAGSVAWKVLAKIKSEPGLSGVKIIKSLQDSDPGVEERTVRTSLRRLRVKHELIEQREGCWYPT